VSAFAHALGHVRLCFQKLPHSISPSPSHSSPCSSSPRPTGTANHLLPPVSPGMGLHVSVGWVFMCLLRSCDCIPLHLGAGSACLTVLSVHMYCTAPLLLCSFVLPPYVISLTVLFHGRDNLPKALDHASLHQPCGTDVGWYHVLSVAVE
jgi:hypothetical protein